MSDELELKPHLTPFELFPPSVRKRQIPCGLYDGALYLRLMFAERHEEAMREIGGERLIVATAIADRLHRELLDAGGWADSDLP